MDEIKTLIKELSQAERVVVLTGAGVSAESGIPTFRDAQTGLWSQYSFTDLATSQAFQANPKLVWDWYAWRRAAVKAAKPNAGHYALVELQNKIPVFTLITQNVDGLHRVAGTRDLIEVHGNIHRVKCWACDHKTETWGDDSLFVPLCEKCGGLLRPDIVWFDESLPYEQMQLSVEAANDCQLYISIGTSGMVSTSTILAGTAWNNGAMVVEINTEDTPLTPHADFVLRGKSGEILPELLKGM